MNLPKSTELKKKIPKQSFYENIDVPANIKKFFVDQIQSIIWRNKISPETTNLAAGETVTEIQVFEIKLNNKELNEEVLRLIDKKIPYHIIFLLECDGKYQAWTAYKEATSSGPNVFRVENYYHTDWINETDHLLNVDGLSVDKVYENFVRQIAGDSLQSEKQESLKDSVERSKYKQELLRKIESLQMKIRKEKQLNKQIRLNAELKSLIYEMESLNENTAD